MGTFFVLPVFLQVVLGFDAFETGKRLLPMSITMLAAALTGPKLVTVLPPRAIVRIGLLAIAGAALMLAGTIDVTLDDWNFRIALAVFGVIETRLASEPLIPFKELTKPLRIANNIVLLFSASLFPMWFVSSLYLQQVLGLSPLHTGLVFLPMTLMIMAVASRAGKLVSRFGVRPVLGGGLVMLAVGMRLPG